jgi:hypothetical protein
MKKLNKVWPGLTILLLIVVIIQFVTYRYGNNKSQINNADYVVKGVAGCTKDCFDFLSVRNVYTGTDTENSPDNIWGGGISPQICEDNTMSLVCRELDISKLPDYKLVSRDIDGKDQKFPVYAYINYYTESKSNHKYYFLYKVLRDYKSQETGWIYDDPLAVISYDVETKKVQKEAQLSVTGINVTGFNASPNGSYLMIVDASNPRLVKNTGLIIFNVKNKSTKQYEESVNAIHDFLTWIDDKSFFYIEYENGSNDIKFKIGTIK